MKLIEIKSKPRETNGKKQRRPRVRAKTKCSTWISAEQQREKQKHNKWKKLEFVSMVLEFILMWTSIIHKLICLLMLKLIIDIYMWQNYSLNSYYWIALLRWILSRPTFHIYIWWVLDSITHLTKNYLP